MKVSPKVLFDKCYQSYGIAAVNVFTMEQVIGLFEAASVAKAPFIVQLTPAARNYADSRMLLAMILAAAERFPQAVYAVHLDHGVEAHILDALSVSGYDSVMIDASHDPFEENVRKTKKIVQEAHSKGVFVEAELGVLSGVEDDITIDSKNAKYTDPDQALAFVQQTNCDSLAIAVGTSHGAYKFSGAQRIQLDLLYSIKKKLPRFPLVLHGGSAVNPAEIELINRFGGTLGTHAAGVPDDDIRAAIKLGVCKINIATDIRLLWTRTHRKFFATRPDQFDPTIPGKEFIQAFKEFMIRKFELFNAQEKSLIFLE
jgi:fructose-bisphosphate aldolase class II